MDAFATRLICSLLFTSCTFIRFTAAADFKCPQKHGVFADAVQCDKFYECEEGVATEKLCPDGLVFDPLNRKVNKCDQPFNVDCGDRLELQEPKSNHLCPRRNGYFADPNEKICNVFYNCIEGEATRIECPTGLHFDEYSGTCVWPESAGRTGCGEPESTKHDKYECMSCKELLARIQDIDEAQQLNSVGSYMKNEVKLHDGFSCPKEGHANNHGQAVAHPVYAHPQDCQKFYVCLNGVTPREQGCSVGEVYNEELKKCDEPENVPGCEDWYKDDPNVQKPHKKKTKK